MICSTATSSLEAEKLGPDQDVGQASKRFQVSFALPVSSSRLIEIVCRSTAPSAAFCRQSQSARSLVKPRLRVMSEYGLSPGCLRELSCLSVPSRYSVAFWVLSSPDASRKPARVMPSSSTAKL